VRMFICASVFLRAYILVLVVVLVRYCASLANIALLAYCLLTHYSLTAPVVRLQRPSPLHHISRLPRDSGRQVRQLGAAITLLGMGRVVVLRTEATAALARDATAGRATAVNDRRIAWCAPSVTVSH
jgi:hypothetical protein